MNVRWNTTPPRIEWKIKVEGEWRGRTVSLTVRNLRRHGVPAPAPGKPVTEWHARRLVAVLAGLAEEAAEPRPGASSLADVIDIYLSNLRVSQGMLDRRERVLRRPAQSVKSCHAKAADISLLGLVGNRPLSAVTTEDMVRYQNLLHDAGYSPMSIRDYLLDLRHFFNYAVRHGYCAASPADSLSLPPSEPSGDIYFLTRDQAATLLETVGDPLDYDAQRRFHLFRNADGRRPFLPTPGNNVLSLVIPGFLNLGLRRSELMRVRWEDVDLRGGVVTVRGARKNPTKTERRRNVPIPGPFLDYLRVKPRMSPLVFTNSKGSQWTQTGLQSALRRFRKTYAGRLGFDFDYQTLRRTYGSLLFQEGFSLDQIAEYLGHSNTATTRRWYAALRAEDHRDLVTRALAF